MQDNKSDNTASTEETSSEKQPEEFAAQKDQNLPDMAIGKKMAEFLIFNSVSNTTISLIINSIHHPRQSAGNYINLHYVP